jgi:hypothetical protein
VQKAVLVEVLQSFGDLSAPAQQIGDRHPCIVFTIAIQPRLQTFAGHELQGQVVAVVDLASLQQPRNVRVLASGERPRD